MVNTIKIRTKKEVIKIEDKIYYKVFEKLSSILLEIGLSNKIILSIKQNVNRHGKVLYNNGEIVLAIIVNDRHDNSIYMNDKYIENKELTFYFNNAKKFISYVRKYKDMKFYSEAKTFYNNYKKLGGKHLIEHLEYPHKYKELLE